MKVIELFVLILGFFKYWGFLLDTVSGVTGLKLTYRSLHCPSDFLSIPLRICPTSWTSMWEKQNPVKDFFHMPYTAPCFRT